MNYDIKKHFGPQGPYKNFPTSSPERQIPALIDRITANAKDTFWVIEFVGEFPRIPGQVNYACIRDIEDPTKQGFMDWTADIHEAIQFHRKQDADRFALVYWWADLPSCVIREHEYLEVED